MQQYLESIIEYDYSIEVLFNSTSYYAFLITFTTKARKYEVGQKSRVHALWSAI